MRRRPLIIIGAGGHGRVVSEVASLNGYREIAFLDDRLIGNESVIGKISDFKAYIDTADFFVAVGDNRVRRSMFMMLSDNHAELVTIVHPNAVVSPTASVGRGVVVMAGAVINAGAKIGDGVIVNTCCSVDHDGELGAFCHVAVGAHLAGTCRIGENTFIGAGVTVINNIALCKDCTIGAGAVVIENIEERGTYVGVPARRLR